MQNYSRPRIAARRTTQALVLALLACSSASAQSDGTIESGAPYYSSGSGSARLGNTPLRIWHSTKGYAQEEAETAFGGRLATDIGTGIAFIDGQFRMSNTSDFGLNVGGGMRWRHSGLLTGDPRIFGASVWYDGDETNLKNYFNQVGLSFESLGNLVDVRFNASFPTDKVLLGEEVSVTDVAFAGNQLSQSTSTATDLGLDNVNAELALRIPDTNVWGYASGYTLQGEGFNTTGYKIGTRGYAYNDLVLDLGVSDDDAFGTLTTFQVTWTPGRTSAGISSCIHGIGDRMREQVYRPNYVATRQSSLPTSTVAATDADGDVIRVVHVDSTATGPGDGTFESPLTSLDNVATFSQEGDIILVHSGSSHVGQTAALQSSQRFLGEGNNVAHTVATGNFGTLTIPESSAGARAGALPTLSGGVNGAILLSDANIPDPTVGPIEVNNIAINGGAVGIRSNVTNGAANTLNVRNTTIANTTANGIEMVGSDWVHNLSSVTLTNAGDGAGEASIFVDGGASNLTFTGSITQANAASAVAVQGGHTGTFSFTEATANAGVIDATNGNGLQFSNADGVYTFNDKVNLHGGDAGIDVTNDSDGTLTFADGEITDPTGTAINFDGGDASMTFTGTVTQNNNVTALSVTGGHNGTLVFNELNNGDGSFEVTNGNGFQFSNADGAYTFNDEVELNGGDAGIDVVNGSDGVLTFANATITNPTGQAVVINGGDTNAVFTYTGTISKNNNGATVDILGGHQGSVVFNAPTATGNVITSTAGSGLEFDNADGTYSFVGGVNLNGANAAPTRVNIDNDSDGSITFARAQITSPTAVAFNVDGGDVDVNFTGKITQANNFAAVNVANGHSGTLTFAESTAGQGVVEATNGTGLQFANADGAYNVNDAVQLNGGDAGIDVTAGSSGTFNFDAASTITNPTGAALNVDGSNATVVYSGSISKNNDGRAVTIQGNTGGSVAVAGNLTNTAAADGVLVQNNTGGTFTFSGTTNITTNGAAGAAFDVVNNDGANLTVAGNANITTTGGQTGVQVTGNNAGTTRFSNLVIDTGTASGFVASAITGTARLEATGTSNTITTTTGRALDLNNVVIGSQNFNIASVNANGGARAIELLDVTGGSVNIGGNSNVVGSGGTIENMTGDAIMATNVVNATFNGLRINNTTGHAIDIDHNSVANASTITVANSQVAGATATGVNFFNSGAATARLTVRDNTITGTSGDGISLNIADGSLVTNLTIDGNNVSNSAAAGALALDSSSTAGSARTVNLLVQDNTLATNGGAAVAGEFVARGTTQINATINNNTFTNSNGASGDPFRVETFNNNSTVRLTMNGNTATAGDGGDDYFLVETAGQFTVQALTAVAPALTIEQSNNGTFDIDPGITLDAGGIPQP